MASTQHTEKFIVEVTYGGSRKTFDDLFRQKHLDTCNAQTIEHSVKKIATKSIRSPDEQALREVLRQAVIAAGYNVGNKAKAKLGVNDARVDYASKSAYDNNVMDRLESGTAGEHPSFSIYLPHIYIAAQFQEPNIRLLAGWYNEYQGKTQRKKTKGLSIFQKREKRAIWREGGGYELDKDGNKVMEWVWTDDWYRKTFIGEATLCLSDPEIINQLTEYVNDLSPERVEAKLEVIRKAAEEDKIEQDRALGINQE